MSIRLKIVCVISFIAFAVVAGGFLSSRSYMQHLVLETAEKDLMIMGDIAESLVAAKIDLLKSDTELIARHLEEASSPQELQVALEAQLSQSKKIKALTVFDRKRRLAFYGTPSTPEGRLHESYLQQALNGESVISTTRYALDTGELVMHVCVPMSHGRALSATIPGLAFYDMLANFQIWNSGSIFILDENGNTLASKNKDFVLERANFIELARQDASKAEIGAFYSRMLREERGSALFHFNSSSASSEVDDKNRLGTFKRISNSSPPWTLGIQAPLEESPAANAEDGLLVSSGFFLLISVIIAVIASYFLARPYHLIEEQNTHLVELTEIAGNASKAKSDFLATVSHEMRTPMNAIIGFSELTLDLEGIRPDVRTNLHKIHNASMTLLNLINDLLDLSKIEAGHFEIVSSEYEVASLINDIISLNSIRIGEKLITFSVELDGDLPSKLSGDELRIRQICNNLLSNAFKYTEEGSVVFSVSHEQDGNDVWLTFAVKDSGIGIRAEDIDKLFSSYTRLDTRKTRSLEGTGLGLALTKQLLQMMDGEIAVESTYGKGSRFIVRLRQRAVTNATIGAETAENLKRFTFCDSRQEQRAAFVRCRIPYARVLIVDDVQTNMDVVRGMMKPYGIQVDCVLSGAAAVEAIRAQKVRYNAVFMDHMMPEMDGIEAARIIREEVGTEYAKSVPLIALTANAILGNEKLFLNNNFQAYLTKPIDILRLDEVIKHWVRNREMENQLLETPEGRLLWNNRRGNDRRTREGNDRCTHKDRRRLADRRERIQDAAPSLCDLSIEGIDLGHCLEQMGGDEEALLHVLGSYAKHSVPLLEDLRRYCNKESLPEYTIAVHGLKSSSRSMGAESLGAMAEVLEIAAREGNYATVCEHNESLIKDCEQLIAALEKLLEQQSAKRQKPQKEAPDKALLDSLRKACAAYNMDGVDTAMHELESYDYLSGGDLLIWLREQVDKTDFQKILDKLDALSATADSNAA